MNTGIVVIALVTGLAAYAFAWSIQREYQLITSTSLLITWILLVWGLIRFLGQANRELSRFLMALEFDDSTNLFDAAGAKGSRRRLLEGFNRVLLSYREIKIRKEMELQLLDSTFDQAGAGMFVMDEGGSTVLCNHAFRELLGIGSFEKLDELRGPNPEVFRAIQKLQPGEQKLLEISVHAPKSFEPENRRQLVLNAREIVLDERRMKVITIQNIRREMEQQESDAWEKLIRVLNHEILNSVSPINLLSASLSGILEKDGVPVDPADLDPEDIEKALVAVKTIRKRGQGLVNFVESYRAITRIPEPVLVDIRVKAFIEGTLTLLSAETEYPHIRFEVEAEPANLTLRADEALLQQSLINLLKNAITAFEGSESASPDPVIRIGAFIYEGRPVLAVSDNGPGIPDELAGKVFTPFFSSRKEGSGIGLSFVHQVMKMHHGSISLSSAPGKGASFILRF